MGKRLISLLLAVVLVLSLAGLSTAFAVEGDEDTTSTETTVTDETEDTATLTASADDSSSGSETAASTDDTASADTVTDDTQVQSDESDLQSDGTVTESAGETTDETTQESAGESTVSLQSANDETAVTASDDGISVASVSGTTTVAVGSTTTLTTNVNSSNGTWSSSDTSIATVSGSGKTVTVTGVSAGTVTITYTYTDRGRQQTDSTTVTVTGSGSSSSNTVTVYVFVAGYDKDTGEYFSDEMLDLLNVNTLDDYGYFAAGTLELDLSQLSGTYNSMITSDEEWEYVLGELATSLVTSNSTTCPNNLIASYAQQVLTDNSASQNNGYSGLWVSYGAQNITDVGGHVDAYGNSNSNGGYRWHLDLRFQTVKITYIYGENGITTSDSTVAYDGNTAGTKVFIQGATMDYTPTITAPEGWKIVGYYTTPDFQEGTEWDAVGQPINEDTTVYIKIVPEDDVVINYVVAEGEGTVTNPSNNNVAAKNGYENFNPTTGTVTGSTATAAEGWTFAGWYLDADCTQPVDSSWVDENGKITPQAPTGGWTEDYTVTYYAKFVRSDVTITITKDVTGNMGDTTKDFDFTLTLTDASGTAYMETLTITRTDDATATSLAYRTTDSAYSFQLSDDDAITITVPYGYSYTVAETDYSSSGYKTYINNSTTEATETTGTTISDVSIAYTNDKDVTPDTGVTLTSLPYLLILTASLSGLGLVLINRKRRNGNG